MRYENRIGTVTLIKAVMIFSEQKIDGREKNHITLESRNKRSFRVTLLDRIVNLRREKEDLKGQAYSFR